MQLSGKTGLVLKISLVLVILLGTVVYKLNDYFQNDRLYSMQGQLRNQLVLIKTTVSSQLSQLGNTLSVYENELSDSNINWVPLDPFFAIAKVEGGERLKVGQILVRSNTPAERWNAAYLEKALAINKSKETAPILAQLFQDRSGEKYIILRFKTSGGREMDLVGYANYFQKFFDINRGDNTTSLLATTEDLLAAHSEGDYIATQTGETHLSAKKYLVEKEEIAGTNLIAVNYILKKKIVSGFVVPWSIVGVVAGVGCLLIALLFYALDPMERKVERYKKQERAQIYKDTLGGLMAQSPLPARAVQAETTAPPLQTQIDTLKARIAERESEAAPQKKIEVPDHFYSIAPVEEEVTQTEVEMKPEVFREEEKTHMGPPPAEMPEIPAEESLDLGDIEKALALDDFDGDSPEALASAEKLEKTLTPQKVSLGPAPAAIEKPQFAMARKEFKVDEIKINVRRPERA